MDIDIFTRGDEGAVTEIEKNKSKRTNKNTGVVTVGVFLGDKDSRQGSIFKSAAATVKSFYRDTRNVNIQFKYLNNHDVFEIRNWKPYNLFDFLRQQDIHVILAHVFQSNIVFPQLRRHWPINLYLRNLDMLQFHLGYPMGKFIICPVFKQQKMEYLNILRNYSTPTIATIFPSLSYYEWSLDKRESARIAEFVVEYSSRCDSKFIGNYISIP